jgi:salicylate hydroxylase
MRADPDTAWLLQKPGLNIWIGDMRHVMSYTIASGRSFNMVLSHPEKSDPKTWNSKTTLEDMKKQFEGWDYRSDQL